MEPILSAPDFRVLFEAAPDLYLVLTPSFDIVGVSDAYLRATMTVRDSIVGRNLFAVFPDNPDDPQASGETNLRNSLQRVLQFRKPDAMPIQKYDVRRPDGAFEERHWSPLNVPVLDAAGAVTWIIHRVEDVTELVRLIQGTERRDAIAREQELLVRQLREANEELMAQQIRILDREALLRSVLATAPDAVVTIDPRGIVQSFNQAAERMFGYAAGEVIGLNVKTLMPSPHQEQHDGYLDHYHRTGERRIIGIGREVEARRKDGSIFPMELAVGEVKTGQSHIFTGFIRDATARLKVEETLRQSQKMEAMGQLTGGIAHDFNNLLTVIDGSLELLARRLRDAENSALLAEAQEAVELGAQLTRRLLAFGRQQELDRKPTDLSTLVAGTLDLLRRTLPESVAVEPRLAPSLPMIPVDRSQAENALLNLAINARDAMPKGGTLTIETVLIASDAGSRHAALDPGLSYIVLAVADTGTGMPPEVLSKALEPFFTTKKEGAGTGLGLSMVYGFVKQSGGQIGIESELGQGTIVRLYLPVV